MNQKYTDNNLQTDIDRLFVAQDIIKELSAKNSFEEVAVSALTLIEKRMGYSAASISMVNNEKDTIQLKYVSDTYLSKILKSLVLNERVMGQYSMKKGIKTLTMRAALEGEVKIDNDITKFTVPPLTRTIAQAIQLFTRTKCMVAVPIRSKARVIAVLNFTVPKDKTEIGVNEQKTLKLFVDQIGLIIDNIINNEEIKSFNKQLEEKVAIATKDLEKRNTNLETLYNLTSNISQTLNPDQVLQTSVNTIPIDEELIGVTVSTYDQITKKISIKATTQSLLAEKALEIIGNFSKYELNLSNPLHRKNLLVRALKEGTPKETKDLYDFVRPILNKSMSEGLNRLLKIENILIYPLLARGEPIGAIVFYLKKVGETSITTEKQQLYSTYASQLSIALENALLFSKSQEITTNLQEARQRERDMVDVMGHELRTPISIVRNALLTLEKDYKADKKIEDQEKLGRYLDMAIESTKREIRLIETLLSATKVEGNKVQLDLTKVDLTDVINDSIEAMKGYFDDKPRVKLIYNAPKRPVYIYSDRVRIQEITDNLLSNAIKYTAEGYVKIDLQKNSDEAWITIKDTGIGIDEPDLKNLGHKFFRAKGMLTEDPNIVQPSGTGLGLFVSFNLLKLLNGRKQIKSNRGKGSTFSFSQPIYRNQRNSRIEGSMVG
ncbi:MAG: ATP-binding protein [Candidatus Dojkabacteria bacterium]|nr:MAG: ATP-binding protein [Candidatus Dojkabacteria bacterium]